MEYAPSSSPPEPIAVTTTTTETPTTRIEYQPVNVDTRTRLSHTVTLGQGSSLETYTAERLVAQGTGPQQANTTVIVNIQGAPAYGAYPSYGYNYGYGSSSRGYVERGGSSSGGRSQWGSTGFEGARRTASPGQTPAVGGNWAPPASFGPAPLR